MRWYPGACCCPKLLLMYLTKRRLPALLVTQLDAAAGWSAHQQRRWHADNVAPAAACRPQRARAAAAGAAPRQCCRPCSCLAPCCLVGAFHGAAAPHLCRSQHLCAISNGSRPHRGCSAPERSCGQPRTGQQRGRALRQHLVAAAPRAAAAALCRRHAIGWPGKTAAPGCCYRCVTHSGTGWESSMQLLPAVPQLQLLVVGSRQAAC